MYSKGKIRNTKLKRKEKIHLVFDSAMRREYLTGFQKRNRERRQKAKEKFENALKAEKKRLKSEARESYKKLVKSYTPIPEVEHLLTNEYENDEVNVKISELSTNELTKTNDWIGANQPHYESEEEEKSEVEDVEAELLPGMELKYRPVKEEEPNESDEDEVNEDGEANEDGSHRSKKDIKKLLKKQAMRNFQKSKMFQKKNRMEKRKQKFQSKKNKLKHQKTNSKHRNKRK